jgi:carbon-monoxide dehydrogenase medium subunit
MFIRRLPRFAYHAPTSLSEAVVLLAGHGQKARVFAGGTDLFVMMKRREAEPERLINLKGIAELKGIVYDPKEGLKIGALVTLGEIEHSKIVQEKFSALWDAVRVMASPQVRTLGTIGGNLCSAMPSADTAAPLMTLGASVRIVGPLGERSTLVEDFFRGPGESVLQPDEILTRILVPEPAENTGGAYLKLMRRHAMDLSQVGVAVRLSLDIEKNTCREAKIALGAVAQTPIRAPMAEQILMNKEMSQQVAKEAGKVASREATPRSSIRASKDYRIAMIGVLTERALNSACERISNHSSAVGRRTGGGGLLR